MELNAEELSLLERWLEDESFIHWAKNDHSADVASWEQYLSRHPQHRELAKAGRQLLVGVPFREIPQNAQRRQQALSQLIDALDQNPSVKPVPRRRSIATYWPAAAAVALLLLASGWLYYQYSYNPEIVLATAYGQTITTTLPDSSVVILNANSALRYRRRTPRLVHLAGEAFFEVKKKPTTGQEFQVFTEDLTVTVLGTSFNVNSRNEQTRVFLEEGRVNLQLANPAADTLHMVPGELVSYSKKSNERPEKRHEDASENTSWKEGVLLFANTPLREVLDEIEAIYGLQFEFSDPALQEQVFQGGVPIRDLEITLNTLRETFGLEISQKGDVYLIDQ